MTATMHHRKRPPKNRKSSSSVPTPNPNTMQNPVPKELTSRGAAYHNRTFRSRTLENATLYNCIITDSKIINCKLFSCTIGHACYLWSNHHHSPDTWARKCQFTDCSISSAKIVRSQIDFTTTSEEQVILDSFIETSTLKHAIVQNTSLLACETQYCQLYDSIFEDHKHLDSSFEGCSTNRTVSLKKLAPEIRMLIFSYCDLGWYHDFAFGWNYGLRGKAKTPALMAACLVDTVLYREVMEAFHKEGNVFLVSDNNFFSRLQMPLGVWHTVKHLSVDADNLRRCRVPLPGHQPSWLNISSLPLRTLNITFPFDMLHEEEHITMLGSAMADVACLLDFSLPPTLEKLSIEAFISRLFYPGCDRLIGFMPYVTLGLGVEVENRDHYAPQFCDVHWIQTTFTWRAEKGKNLSFDRDRASLYYQRSF